jgi:transcriptional regulator with XRE-family HTH domain
VTASAAARNRSRVPQLAAEETPDRIGERLRALRVGRGFSISQLAELSGVPGSTISKIENSQLRPSLVNAIKLAHALNENLGFLVGRYRNPPSPLVTVRALSRDTIDYKEMGLSLQDLNGRFFPGLLEARVGILSRGASSGSEPMAHPGEEFCHVIAGEIRYRIAAEEITLKTRQYIQFKSDIKHSWQNILNGETRVLWVFSDGLSF